MNVSEITEQEMIYAVESAEMMMLCDETFYVENVQIERWVPPALTLSGWGYVHTLFLSTRYLDLLHDEVTYFTEFFYKRWSWQPQNACDWLMYWRECRDLVTNQLRLSIGTLYPKNKNVWRQYTSTTLPHPEPKPHRPTIMGIVNILITLTVIETFPHLKQMALFRAT